MLEVILFRGRSFTDLRIGQVLDNVIDERNVRLKFAEDIVAFGEIFSEIALVLGEELVAVFIRPSSDREFFAAVLFVRMVHLG